MTRAGNTVPVGTYVVNVTGQFASQAIRKRRADLTRHLKEHGVSHEPAAAVPLTRGLPAHQGRWVIQADDVLTAIGRASAAYKAAAEQSGLDLPIGMRVHLERETAGAPRQSRRAPV